MDKHCGVTVKLVNDRIEISAYQDLIADPDTGAQGWFLGVTRRTTKIESQNKDMGAETKVTESLFYEAHEEMAIKVLSDLAEEAKTNFSLSKVVIIHRLGKVPIGEASVIIGCSSAHRVACFDALPWIMNHLKADVPIWKQETYVDGQTEWQHPT